MSAQGSAASPRGRDEGGAAGSNRRLRLALACGLVFGLVDVLLMIPLPIEDKPLAMLGAFVGRFAIGFFVPTVQVPIPGVAKGVLIGAWLSLSASVLTGVWAPILGIGAVGGGVIGFVEGRMLGPRRDARR